VTVNHAGRGPRLLRRLGLPTIAGSGPFVVANAIDSLGYGLMFAFPIVYFAETTSLSLPQVGAAMTIARLLTLPAPMLAGPLLDRFGARAVGVTGMAISAVGFLGFLVAHASWQVILVTALTHIGSSVYSVSSSALVVLAAVEPEERTRWFGFVRVLRNIGVGLGGALGAAAVGVGGEDGLRGIVVANALSFVIALWLIGTWSPRRPSPPPVVPVAGKAAGPATGNAPATGKAAAASAAGAPTAPVSYLAVLRDGAYMRLVAVNVAIVFAAVMLGVLLAIAVTDGLHQDTWYVGALIVVNTGMVITTQTVATVFIERYRPTRVIAVSCLLNAAAFGVFALLHGAPGWLVVAGLFAGIFLYTVAEIAAVPPTSELSVALAPEHARGRYLAVFQMSWTVGGALAPWLLTSLFAQGPVWPWIFLLALSVLAVPVVLSLERTMARPRQSEAVPI